MKPSGGARPDRVPAASAVATPFGEVDAKAEQVMVPMRDGVRLATDVYLPARTPAPVVLVRLPYDKTSTFSFMPQIGTYICDRGYGFVAQDVRGKVRSEGDAFAFTSEVDDGADTLDWIESQRWCDGSIVMFGDSYYGFTQWAAAASGHTALKAIVPQVTTTEIGTDWMYHQGVFCMDTMLGWASSTWMGAPVYEFPNGIDWRHSPLAEIIPSMFEGRPSPSLDAWRAAPPQDAFWTRDIFAGRTVHPPRIPVLHSGGWWDVFRRGQMRDWQRARGAGAPGQHLLFEHIDHYGGELTSDGEPVLNYLEDPSVVERMLPRYLDPAIEFYDYYVRGRGDMPPPVRWRLANADLRSDGVSWPPEGARPVEFFLCDAASASKGPAGGALRTTQDRLEQSTTWTHDPADPVPDLISDVWCPLLGLPDEREVEMRPDVVTFTSEEMSAPFDIAGNASADLFVRSSCETTHVMAKLVDVFPNGRARRIAEGASLMRAGSGGGPVQVDLGPTGYRLASGHRLRLEVAASDSPRYIVHPGTSEDPWTAETFKTTEQRLSVGGDRSCLRLSAIPYKT